MTTKLIPQNRLPPALCNQPAYDQTVVEVENGDESLMLCARSNDGTITEIGYQTDDMDGFRFVTPSHARFDEWQTLILSAS